MLGLACRCLYLLVLGGRAAAEAAEAAAEAAEVRSPRV